jgi:hypothetical protein
MSLKIRLLLGGAIAAFSATAVRPPSLGAQFGSNCRDAPGTLQCGSVQSCTEYKICGAGANAYRCCVTWYTKYYYSE